MTPATLLERADRAIASAEVLLGDGDAEGASNRAYFAMFNAARAALILISAPLEVTAGKSHSGLHAAFSQYLIKPGHLPQALGTEFRRAERLRQVSDYLGDLIGREQAEAALQRAREFVHRVKTDLARL